MPIRRAFCFIWPLARGHRDCSAEGFTERTGIGNAHAHLLHQSIRKEFAAGRRAELEKAKKLLSKRIKRSEETRRRESVNTRQKCLRRVFRFSLASFSVPGSYQSPLHTGRAVSQQLHLPRLPTGRSKRPSLCCREKQGSFRVQGEVGMCGKRAFFCCLSLLLLPSLAHRWARTRERRNPISRMRSLGAL